MKSVQVDVPTQPTPLFDFKLTYAKFEKDGTHQPLPVRYIYWGKVKDDDLP